MTPRTHLNIRLSPEGIKEADDIAREHGLSRSQVLRAAIKVGFRATDSLRYELRKAKETL